MKKTLLFLLLVCLCVPLLWVSAAGQAAETDPLPDSGGALPDPADGTGGEDAPSLREGSAETPWAGRLLVLLEEYTGEVLCALTLLSSLVLAFLYKKGLLPLLSGGLSALGSAVGKVRDATARLTDETEGKLDRFFESVAPVLAKIEAVSAYADHLAAETRTLECRLEAAAGERQVMQTLLSAQADLFYGFFMAVNLPQYQKDELGQRYRQMKDAIEAAYAAEGGHEA
ncbi:MAG: hypothetical protein WDA00_06430 [Eubacteriales bacterium]